MPIPLTPSQREALRGQIKVRTLIDFYLDSGRYSFWDGDGNVDFDGTTYLAAAEFGEISSISLGQDLGAEGIEISLNGTALVEASPAASNAAALFGSVETENYQMRRVEIRFAFFSAETDELVLLVKRFAGFIDQMRQVEEFADGVATEWLRCALESIARRYSVRGARTRSNDDQLDIWASDEGFKFTASAISKQGTLYWGRRGPRTGGGGGGGGGGTGDDSLVVHV